MDTVKQIPLDKIVVATDAPFCMTKEEFAGHQYVETRFNFSSKDNYTTDRLVGGRNEPCGLVQVVEVLAGLFEMDKQSMAEQLW